MKEFTGKLHYLFRIACAMCFIGHGAFGIITKQVWCNYFGVFGIGNELAYQLMPVVGIVDITMGICLLVYPIRGVAAWLIFWGLFTALLRPLSREPVAEFFERAGNYGAPLILLLLDDNSLKFGKWFKKLKPSLLPDEKRWQLITKCLQITGFFLLFGHGWLNISEKAGLLKQYASVGFSNTTLVAHIVGYLEITGALLILFKPIRHIILILFIWKVCSEMFYPAYGFFEWVERGGSYSILLGLWLVVRVNDQREQKIELALL